MAGIEVRCPRCNQSTPSLKQVKTLEWFVCAFIFFWGRRVTYNACPSCMRVLLLQRLGYNLLPANVAIVFIGPVYIAQILGTFATGHSKAIQARLPATESSNESRRQPAGRLTASEASSIVASLPAVHASLDRGEYATALDQLRAITDRLQPGGDCASVMKIYLMNVERGYFAALKSTLLPAFPLPLRAPLTEILEKFASAPGTVSR